MEQLRDYFEQHPACLRASAKLKPGTRVGLRVLKNEGPESNFVFERLSSSNRLTACEEMTSSIDLLFEVPEDVMNAVLALPSDDLGDIGAFVLQHVFGRSSGVDGIQVRVYASTLTLLKHGYFSVLALGGQAVVRLLSSHGLNFISLRHVVGKLRS